MHGKFLLEFWIYELWSHGIFNRVYSDLPSHRKKLTDRVVHRTKRVALRLIPQAPLSFWKNLRLKRLTQDNSGQILRSNWLQLSFMRSPSWRFFQNDRVSRAVYKSNRIFSIIDDKRAGRLGQASTIFRMDRRELRSDTPNLPALLPSIIEKIRLLF